MSSGFELLFLLQVFRSFCSSVFRVCGLFSTVLQRVVASTTVAPFLDFQLLSGQLNVIASYKYTKMDEEKQEKKEKPLHEYATQTPMRVEQIYPPATPFLPLTSS
jgi:hypothetical protein